MKKGLSLDIATTFPEFLAIHFQLDDINYFLISHNHWKEPFLQLSCTISILPVLSHLVVHGKSTTKEHASCQLKCLAFLLRQDTIHHLSRDPMSVCNCCDVSKLTCQSLPVAEHCAPKHLKFGIQPTSFFDMSWMGLTCFLF